MWELQMAAVVQGIPACSLMETELIYSYWLNFTDQYILFHYSKASTEETCCEHARFFQVEGGESHLCSISETCFSDFTWFQEAFLLILSCL